MDICVILLLRFFASSLLGNFALFWKKYQCAPSLLRFYASWRKNPKRTGSACGKIRLCYFASSLLRFLNNVLRKNHPPLLRFFASTLLENLAPKKIRLCYFASSLPRFLKKQSSEKSGFATSLLRFHASWKFGPKKNQALLLRFFASTLLEKFSQKKSPFASTLLRFHASWKVGPKKNQALLLRFILRLCSNHNEAKDQ